MSSIVHFKSAPAVAPPASPHSPTPHPASHPSVHRRRVKRLHRRLGLERVEMSRVTGALDALDELRAKLTCPLCERLFTSPSTLPCAHTQCHACATEHVDNRGKGFVQSGCAECGAPTELREVQVNQTLREFVEAFRATEGDLREILANMRAIGRESGSGATAEAVETETDERERGMEAEDPDAERRLALATCEEAAEEIRVIDAELRAIEERMRALTSESGDVTMVNAEMEMEMEMEEEEEDATQAPKFASMNLTQLRKVYRDLYGAPAPQGRKKGWFTKHFTSLDPEVVASALVSTQPDAPAAAKIVVAYSSSARRQSGNLEEMFAQAERKIKSVDPKAVFLGVKDLTSECTHLIMDTGSSSRDVKNRTAKYIEAIVRGLYIVHIDWLDDCAERGEFGNEEAFELKDATISAAAAKDAQDGPRRARIDRATNSRGLFHGITLRVKGCGRSLSVSALERILKLAGATIVPDSPNTPRRSLRTRKSMPNADQVPDSEDETPESETPDAASGRDGGYDEETDEESHCLTLVDDTTEEKSANAVLWTWALECVCCYELLPTVRWRVGGDAAA